MAAEQDQLLTRLTALETAIKQLTDRVAALEPTTTPGAPAVSAVDAAEVTTTAAQLTGFVEPQGQPFVWQFHYGTTTSYGSVAPATPAAADGIDQAVQTQITGLTPGTTYHFKLVATNSAGSTSSPDVVFGTFSPPTDPTVELDHQFDNTAVGSGLDQAQYTGSWSVCTNCAASLDPPHYRYAYTSGASLTLRFHGVRLSVHAPNDSAGASAAPVTVDGQPAGTANFQRVSGGVTTAIRFDTGVLGTDNADHTVVISVPSSGNKWISFWAADVYTVTAGGGTITAPAVTSNPATAVTSTSATLSGTVTPNGAASAWRFEYGTTLAYGGLAPIPDGSVPAGAAAPVTATLTGLTPGTTYNYRLRATNSAGSTVTTNRSFVATATTSPAGRITRSGTQLMLGGRQWKFAGTNAPFFVSCGGSGSQPDAAYADRFFRELNPRSLTRIWCMPNMPLSQFDLIVQAAKANGQYLNVCLFNGLADCTAYRASYETPLNSNIANWIQTVVSRHAGDPTIAMYECANEATESHPNIGNWYQAVAQRIKSIDPQVLVGTGGGNNSNNAQAIANFASGSAIDLISYHGYYSPAGSREGRTNAFVSAATIAGKPWYAGERGFCCGGGTSGNKTTDGQRLKTEYDLYLAVPNCAGYLYWDYRKAAPYQDSATFGDGMWAVMSSYRHSYTGG